MTDVGYVIAGYAVILGGLAVYATTLLRRLARARDPAQAAAQQAGGAASPAAVTESAGHEDDARR